jgi:carboxyl-terminal processing protease
MKAKSLEYNMLHRFWRSVALIVVLLPLALPVGAGAAPSSQNELYERVRENIGLFGDVYREISLRYVDSIDPDEFVRAGIDGMLATLDPYTVLYDDSQMEDLEILTTGRYGGVGIEIGVRGEKKVLTVITAMDDSPAQRVGIRSGDRIVEIDSQSTEGFTTAKAAEFLRGDPGTQVTIKIMRSGSIEPIEFVITRDEIEIKDVPYYGFVEPGIGYIKLAHFSRRAAEELDHAVSELFAGGMEKLVLDLRSNPGGLLPAAVAVSQRVCPKGKVVVSTRGRMLEAARDFTAPTDPILGDVPLVVLVNGGSASASEIVAGAVQDLDRGVIVGQPTFGKGLVQSVISFESGKALKLTTAKYYTPSGRLIQKVDYFSPTQSVLTEDTTQAAPDSFATLHGRPVYGGGGISPDVFVPVPEPNRLGTELWRQGKFFDFVTEYRARHPNLTSADISDQALDEFQQWLEETDFVYRSRCEIEFADLEAVVEEEGMTEQVAGPMDSLRSIFAENRLRDFEQGRQFIRQSLQHELAANLWGSRGRTEASFKDDPQLLKAIEILRDQPGYRALLALDMPADTTR